MKTFRYWNFLAAAVALLSAATVIAQTTEQGNGGRITGESPNDPTNLLASASVQTELALTDAQKASLQQLRSNDENGAHPFFGGFAGKSQQEIQRRIDEHAKTVRDQVATILSPQQRERLDEINIQFVGVAALGYEDVADKIGLTAEQRAALKAAGDDARQQMAEANSVFTSGKSVTAEQRQSHQQKISAISAERKSQALTLLTDEQKSAFAKLQGASFDVSTIRPNYRSFNRRGHTDGASVAASRKK